MEEAEVLTVEAFERLMEGAGLLEQPEGAVDVGPEESVRTKDGAFDMAFGSEMDDGAGVMVAKYLSEEFGVVEIAVDEGIAGGLLRVCVNRSEVLGLAGIGKAVEVNDG